MFEQIDFDNDRRYITRAAWRKVKEAMRTHFALDKLFAAMERLTGPGKDILCPRLHLAIALHHFTHQLNDDRRLDAKNAYFAWIKKHDCETKIKEEFGVAVQWREGNTVSIKVDDRGILVSVEVGESWLGSGHKLRNDIKSRLAERRQQQDIDAEFNAVMAKIFEESSMEGGAA